MRASTPRAALVPALLLALHFTPALCTAANNDPAAGAGASLLLNPLDLDAGSLRAFEAFLVVLVVLFCANFARGARQNLTRARALADVLDDALRAQFAAVGVAGGPGKRLVRDGARKFWYYATGRLRTTGFVAALVLRPRQDLFAEAGALFRGAEPETIVALAPVDAAMDPLSVLLMRRRELARWRDFADGAALKAAQRLAGEVADYPALAGDFVVMAEHKDTVTAVLNDRVRAALKPLAPHLRSLHVTEFGAAWEPQCTMAKKIVRVEVVLPESDAERKSVVEKTAALVCLLVDVAANAKISAVAKKKAVELRRVVLAEEEKIKQKVRREEIAAEKEAKKKEKEAAVSKMSREKQAKHDEKMRKKAFKDRLKKVSVK